MTAALDLEMEPRRFFSVKSAMLFYERMRRARMVVSPSLESGRTPRSRAERERDQLTYARIVPCLVLQSPEDYDEEYRLFPSWIEVLLSWYFEGRKAFLADKLGMSEQVLSQFCAHMESVLRRRMQARGLLEER